MADRPKKQWLSVPGWALIAFILVSVFNVIIFLTLVAGFLRPDTVPVPITGDVAIALHLQLLEVILAAIAIGFAIFGFIGYTAIRDAAERRADATAREVMQAYAMDGAGNGGGGGISQEPNLEGLSDKEPEPEQTEAESEKL